MKTGTENHMKTKMLKRMLGLVQFEVVGVLECLWLATSRCAWEDGAIGKFDNENIAAELEWRGDADELVNALIQCGFLDEVNDVRRLVVHGWLEHCPEFVKKRIKRNGGQDEGIETNVQTTADNGSQRPINQANPTKPNQTKPSKPNQDSLSSGDDGTTPETVLQEFNKTPGVTPARTLNRKRTQTLKTRLRDPQWQWREALLKFPLPCFTDDSWTPNFDWFIRPDTVSKILEGQYDWQKNRDGPGKPAKMEFKGLHEFLKDGEDDTS